MVYICIYVNHKLDSVNEISNGNIVLQITVGVFGHEEEVIDKPISPGEVKNILYSRCSQYDMLQAVLQQELILGIGKLIAASPELFDGILKIRIG
jgi:phosphorylase kinase alpha/beta subunit